MKTAAKVFIILNMIFLFWAIFPLVVGIIALNKLNSAKSKDDLVAMGIITIFFCSLLGGIFMLLITDDELQRN